MLWLKKRARDIMFLIFLVSDARVRLKLSLPKAGKDKVLDRSIRKSWEFFIKNGLDANSDAKKVLKDKAIEIYRWLCNNARAKKDRAEFLRLMHLYLTTANEKEEASELASRYRKFYKTELVPVELPALKKRPFVLLKRLRIASQTHSKAQMRMLSFELKHLTMVIPVPSVIFVIAGYVYTALVYGYFGIDVTQFFTLGDYLAGSINQIGFAMASIAIYLFTVIGLYRERHQFSVEFSFKSFRHFPLTTSVLLAIPVCFFLLLCFLYVYEWRVLFWLLAPFSVFFILQTLVARMVSRVFKNPFHMTAAVMLALIFSASIFLQSVKKIASIATDSEYQIFTVETTEERFTNVDFVFLGGNERYIFLLGKEYDAAVIIPFVEIKWMNMHYPNSLWARFAR